MNTNKNAWEKALSAVKTALAAVKAEKWKIYREYTQSYQLYCIRGKIDVSRFSDSDEISVTVYSDSEGGMGSSTFRAFAPYDRDELIKKAADALGRARLISDKPYPVSEKTRIRGSACGDAANYTPAQLAEKAFEAAESVSPRPGCTVNAMEIFAEKKVRAVLTSDGADCEESSCRVFVEAIPTCTTSERSVELYKTHYLTGTNFGSLKRAAESWLCEAELRCKAMPPAVKPRCPVVFRAEEFAEILAALAADSDFSAVYAGSNRYSKGDLLSPGGKCPLTVTLKGAADGCADGKLFDDDAVKYRDVTIIENGKVAAYHGSLRFASYLGCKATGKSPCIQAEAGFSAAEQLTEGALTVYSMSGIQVDVYGDYIGGEVRLGVMREGGKLTPVTGISISGKLSEVLGTLILSREVTALAGYRGPAYVRADKMEIF